MQEYLNYTFQSPTSNFAAPAVFLVGSVSGKFGHLGEAVPEFGQVSEAKKTLFSELASPADSRASGALGWSVL